MVVIALKVIWSLSLYIVIGGHIVLVIGGHTWSEMVQTDQRLPYLVTLVTDSSRN